MGPLVLIVKRQGMLFASALILENFAWIITVLIVILRTGFIPFKIVLLAIACLQIIAG
jgi:hypothetical protein